MGPGRLFALGDGKGILIGLLGNGTVGGYVGLQVPEDWLAASGLSFDQPAQMRAAVLSQFSDWDPALTAIIRHCDEPLTLIQINMLPTEHRWEHRPGVTLIGDAAHLMSTFAGVGVNFAMLDALELALALTQTTDSAPPCAPAKRRCSSARPKPRPQPLPTSKGASRRMERSSSPKCCLKPRCPPRSNRMTATLEANVHRPRNARASGLAAVGLGAQLPRERVRHRFGGAQVPAPAR